MFDGRHCTNKDLDLLIKETNKVKACPSQIGIENYLKLIERFDLEIARELAQRIKSASDKENIKQIIDSKFKELKQLVIVDIFEHEN